MQPCFLKLAKGLSSRPPTQPSLPGAGDLLPEAELGKVLTSPGLCLELAFNHNYSYQKNLLGNQDPRRGPLMEEWWVFKKGGGAAFLVIYKLKQTKEKSHPTVAGCSCKRSVIQRGLCILAEAGVCVGV